MGRKKRAVEGFVLNLDDFINSDMTIETLLTEMEKKATPVAKPRKRKSETKAKTDEEILAGIRSTYTCHTCGKPGFSKYVKKWRGHTLCIVCHQHERSTISAELEEYIKGVYSRGCTFCDAKKGRFHLDHINMFSKVGSVGVMIESGCSAETIKEEIAKCQLLCYECHMLVTTFEVRRGFIKEKSRMTRKISAGEDVTELRQKLYDEYDAVMTKMYPLIRAKVREVGCVGESVEASGGGIDGSELGHETDADSEDSYGDCDGDF